MTLIMLFVAMCVYPNVAAMRVIVALTFIWQVMLAMFFQD